MSVLSPELAISFMSFRVCIPNTVYDESSVNLGSIDMSAPLMKL